MYIKVSTTVENSKRKFFDVNANNGRSATFQCLYSTQTTITIISTILHCEGMHTISLSDLSDLANQVRLYKPKVLCYVTW